VEESGGADENPESKKSRHAFVRENSQVATFLDRQPCGALAPKHIDLIMSTNSGDKRKADDKDPDFDSVYFICSFVALSVTLLI
jgi:hypothetical protein